MRRRAVRKAAWVCLPFAAAVAFCRYLVPESGWIPAGVACLLALIPSSLLRGRARTRAFLALIAAAVGFGACTVQSYTLLRPCEALVGERREVTLRVTDYPDAYDDSAYVTVQLTQDDVPRVRCRLVSYTPGELDGLVPGDELRATVRFASAAVRNGRQVDNYTSQGVFLRASCVGPPERLGRWRFSALYYPATLCESIVGMCRQRFPRDAAPFMTALLTGNKADLYDDESYYDLAEAGLAHVVAVSGMHISYLAGFLFLLLGRRRWAVVLSFPILLFFAAMTGFTPSVTRAVFMQMCLLSAPLFRREEDALTSLSVILAAMLLRNPCAIGGASLQLSFASMAGIWLVSGRIYTALHKRLDATAIWRVRVLRPALAFITATFSSGVGAQVFTLPLCAVHFGYVSTVSPLANFLCLWLISTLYLGGYLTVTLAAILPAAGAMLGGVLSWGVRYIRLVTRLLRYLPCECVYMLAPVNAVWLIFSYTVFGAAWWRGRRSGFRPVAPMCLSLLFLYATAIGTRLGWDEDLRLTALDVGQGESVVLTCGPRSAVIDCGGSFVPHDAGDAAVSFLRAQQRTHLDALILTHLHADHVNGAAEVLTRLDVDTLYLPLQPDEDGYLPAILTAARRSGTRVYWVTEDITLGLGDMELTIWAPVLSGDENENCLMILAAQNDFEALVTGDSLAAAEWLLCARSELPDAEVLVVGHHGSKTSTCAALLEELRPDLALISVGYNNYGHPHAEVLRRLENYHIPVLRTDEEGSITVKAGG